MKKVVAVSVLVITSVLTQANAASCQCVDYVKKRINYTGSLTGSATGGAKDSGNTLVGLGYKWQGNPAAGDIVVFQPNHKFTDGSGVDTIYGHIAFVESASFDSANKTWAITYWGANQPGSYRRTDFGCDNVTTAIGKKYKAFDSESQRTVSFYRK